MSECSNTIDATVTLFEKVEFTESTPRQICFTASTETGIYFLALYQIYYKCLYVPPLKNQRFVFEIHYNHFSVTSRTC